MRTIAKISRIKQDLYSISVIIPGRLILLFLGLSALSVNAQQITDSENVQVWAVPGEQKVRPADKPETTNLVWSAEKKLVKVSGAGNEHVPFQVVITTPVPPGWRPKAPDGFFISASDLTSASGKTISNKQVNLFLEHYIQIYAISSPVGATGLWPDALAPLKVPFSMQAQYKVVGNRPVWVDVFIPSGTTKGIYKGTITITRFDKVIETLGVEVEVYGFSLPEETHLITYVNISKGEIARFYNKPVSSPEIDQLSLNYFEFLSSHRMETWFNDPLVPELTIKGEDVEVKFNDQRYDYFLNKMKLKRVILETVPRYLEVNIKEEPFSPGFNKKVKSYLSAVESYFRKNGWRDRLVFNSPIDEPNTMKDYEETRKYAELVHAAVPGIPFLATESPVSDNPDWGTLRGYVNNFCVHGNSLNDPEVKQALREEQAKGGEATWYISCDQAYPQPNYFIDAPVLDPVMVPWITERYKMNGILYWAANFWNQTPDPWLDPVTYISGFDCSDGYVLNGEGSLIYPGDHAKRYTGQPDVVGPISSIRFEMLREGIEDYEYIWMLKNKGAADFAEEQVRNMVIDVSTFSRNLEDLYLTRKAMARKLEQLSK
ncbi:MAG TPA: glycoside hydrolase domain-containing protein [Bacteroidales bacterium]|nr:glycoside hydrolase domain-containing protein [Bacteroidales bacterium]